MASKHWFACLSASAVLALLGGCGPPPAILSGKMSFSYGCDQGCTGGFRLYDSARMGSALLVDCVVQPASGTERARVRFTIAAEGSGSLTSSLGVNVCGEVGPNNQLVNTRTNLYFNGAQSINQTTNCRIDIRNLVTTEPASFSGSMSCNNALDNDVPPKSRFIRGIGGTTMDPNLADFEFSACVIGLVPCA